LTGRFTNYEIQKLQDGNAIASAIMATFGSPNYAEYAPDNQKIAEAVCNVAASVVSIDQLIFVGRLLKYEQPTQESEKEQFRKLVQEWKSERRATSSSIEIVMHPAYQKIIAMGRVAIPWILEELQRETDHWFWALRLFAEEDPVPPHSRGRIAEMRDAWLKWGHEHRYV
jgi:hypothetical protein